MELLHPNASDRSRATASNVDNVTNPKIKVLGRTMTHLAERQKTSSKGSQT